MPSRYTRFRVFQLTAIITLLLAVSVVLVSVTFPLTLVFTLCAVLLTGVFVWNPMLAVYGMALTYPYLNTEIVFGSLNVPIVDIFGLCSVIALTVRTAINIFVYNKKNTLPVPPGWLLWLAFLGIALLSTHNAFVLGDSMKYVARPLAFFFIVFVITVPGIVRTEKALRITIILMMITSLLVAVYGFLGLIVVKTPSLLQRRVIPFSLFGYYPLGDNHNLIADVMVTSLPLAWYLWSTSRDRISRRLFLLAMIFLTITGLLTFSRTAWLAFIVEGLVLIRISYAHIIRHVFPLLISIMLAASPLIIYMFVFMQQAEIQSSNENRIMLGEIALDMWNEHPYIGAGPGTFMSYVQQNPIYMKDFGSPLDAHSVLYKVLAETGVFGFVAFFGMCFMVFRRLFLGILDKLIDMQDRFFLVCLFTTCIGGFFFQFFQTSYYVSKLWFPIGIALSATYILRQKHRVKE